jgi:hypothetical protein
MSERSVPRQDWRALLAAYFIVSVIESAGVAQIFALLPARLSELGVTGRGDRGSRGTAKGR